METRRWRSHDGLVEQDPIDRPIPRGSPQYPGPTLGSCLAETPTPAPPLHPGRGPHPRRGRRRSVSDRGDKGCCQVAALATPGRDKGTDHQSAPPNRYAVKGSGLSSTFSRFPVSRWPEMRSISTRPVAAARATKSKTTTSDCNEGVQVHRERGRCKLATLKAIPLRRRVSADDCQPLTFPNRTR